MGGHCRRCGAVAVFSPPQTSPLFRRLHFLPTNMSGKGEQAPADAPAAHPARFRTRPSRRRARRFWRLVPRLLRPGCVPHMAAALSPRRAPLRRRPPPLGLRCSPFCTRCVRALPARRRRFEAMAVRCDDVVAQCTSSGVCRHHVHAQGAVRRRRTVHRDGTALEPRDTPVVVACARCVCLCLCVFGLPSFTPVFHLCYSPRHHCVHCSAVRRGVHFAAL